MKTNESTIQEPVILMERRRRKECWRIRRTYHRPFLTHLQHYFGVDAQLSFAMEDVLRNALYIDIDERDFCLVSFLFAAFGVSGDRIVTKGIFPPEYLPQWEDHITLHLCLKENGRQFFMSLRLEIKRRREMENK